jgi:hypothetical protein
MNEIIRIEYSCPKSLVYLIICRPVLATYVINFDPDTQIVPHLACVPEEMASPACYV